MLTCSKPRAHCEVHIRELYADTQTIHLGDGLSGFLDSFVSYCRSRNEKNWDCHIKVLKAIAKKTEKQNILGSKGKLRFLIEFLL